MRLIFEWDDEKAQKNQRKHRVGFEEAKTIFSDPLLVSFPDEYHSEDEQRLISIGRIESEQNSPRCSLRDIRKQRYCSRPHN